MKDQAPLNGTRIKNCFSVDVEGFVESNVQSFSIPAAYVDKRRENYEIERNVDVLLLTLSECNVHGTFFFLGRIARDIPCLVQRVAQQGHEIACHSYDHMRIYGMQKDEFKGKVKTAKERLEDVSGRSVYGFRAPDFSITEASLWALDILQKVGFCYDSSVYPIGLHDVYGVKDIEPFVHKLPNGLIEVPLSSVEILGKRFPFGGGGYFRLYPLYLTKRLIAKYNNLGYPCMFYIHPYEVGPEIPQISELSFYRKFRHYYNCNNGSRRLKKMLQAFKFGTVIDMLERQNLKES